MEKNYNGQAANRSGLEGIGGFLTMRNNAFFNNGGLTQEQQDAYVDAHNNYRKNVDPPASNMKKMVIFLTILIKSFGFSMFFYKHPIQGIINYSIYISEMGCGTCTDCTTLGRRM